MLVDPQAGWLEMSVSAGGRLDLWLLGCVLLPCAPFAAMIITSRCSQETQVGRKKGLQPRGQTIEVEIWGTSPPNPHVFWITFQVFFFWVGDFCWCWFWMFQHHWGTEKISEWLGISSRWLHAAPIFRTFCTRPYSNKIFLTTQYHLEHAERIFDFATSHLLEHFCFKIKKQTNQPPPPNNNTLQQQKYISSWWPPFVPESYPTKTGFDLQLHRYPFGSQWSSTMPLLYLGTTSDHQADWRWGGVGDRWRWLAYIGVFFENSFG